MISAVALAFVVNAPTGSVSDLLKWPAAAFPLEFQVHSDGCASTGGCVEAAQNAFEAWESISGSLVSFSISSYSGAHPTFSSSGGSDGGNGINRVASVQSGWPAAFSSSIGITDRRRVGTEIVEADVYFNESNYSFGSGGELPCSGCTDKDAESVLAHEVGHVIGLAHSPARAATMFFFLTDNNIAPRTLSLDEAAAARFLYPAGGYICSANGDCPSVQDPATLESFGRMLCTAASECCFGGSCGSGTVGSVGDLCDEDSDCGSGLHCPYIGTSCVACSPGSGAAYSDCLSGADCQEAATCALFDDGQCGMCLPSCTSSAQCPGVATCYAPGECFPEPDDSDGVVASICDDGTCDDDEDCASCAEDCGDCPSECGDGTCDGSEDCVGCLQDCGLCPAVCGDGDCNGNEDCTSCVTDCGMCPPCDDGDTLPCGDGACQGLQSCVAGVWQSCDGSVPTKEICENDIDEDCNGAADDGCPGFVLDPGSSDEPEGDQPEVGAGDDEESGVDAPFADDAGSIVGGCTVAGSPARPGPFCLWFVLMLGLRRTRRQ